MTPFFPRSIKSNATLRISFVRSCFCGSEKASNSMKFISPSPFTSQFSRTSATSVWTVLIGRNFEYSESSSSLDKFPSPLISMAWNYFIIGSKIDLSGKFEAMKNHNACCSLLNFEKYLRLFSTSFKVSCLMVFFLDLRIHSCSKAS